MSIPLKIPRNVALSAWVDQVKSDPVRYVERQVTEILLHAIGITPKLNDTLVLKGGVLMSLAHGSFRQTGDVDFTARIEPEPYAGNLKELLNTALRRSALDLGYVDLLTAVQRFEYRPRPETFADSTAPALDLSIGYAQRGTADESRFHNGKASRVIQVDISFREKVMNATELIIEEPHVAIQAYTIEEIIAEKFRAQLQQVPRNRARRQDVFDIDWLLHRYAPNEEMRAKILIALLAKSEDREIAPLQSSFDNPELKERANANWNSMGLEIGGKLPDFEEAFARVRAFYRSLPWNNDE